MKKSTTIVVAIAAVMIAATAVHAGKRGQRADCTPRHGMQQDYAMGMGQQGRGMHGKQGGGIHMLLGMADEIGLSEDQVGRLKTMAVEFRKSMIDDRAELQKTQVDFHAMQMDDDKSGDVLKLMDDIGRMKTELRKTQYLHRQQIEGVLTDDQRTKLEELRKERRSDRQGRGMKGSPHGMQKGHGMGYGPGDGDGTGYGFWDSDGN